MPRLLRIPAPQGDADPLTSLIELALQESSRPAAGARCMLLRLSELMCIEVIRRHLNSISNEDTGWLAALGDPLVGRCLTLLHQHFERPWTLEQLAGEIGSSRSILAQRFTELVGQPPMQYLANWRMQVAARKLENPNLKTFAIAQEVGYESEAAFSRAFKRLVGITPGQWRRRHSV